MDNLAKDMRADLITTLSQLQHAISSNKNDAISCSVSVLRSMLFTFKANIILSHEIFDTNNDENLQMIFQQLKYINDEAYKYLINTHTELEKEIEITDEHDPLYVIKYIDDLLQSI